MIQKTPPESSAMEKTSLESCTLHEIIPESPNGVDNYRRDHGREPFEGESHWGGVHEGTNRAEESHGGGVSPLLRIHPESLTMEKTMSQGPFRREMA